MKSFFISIVSLIILIFVWVGFYYLSIEKNYIHFTDELNDLAEVVVEENWEKAINMIEEDVRQWNKTRELWIYFLNQHHVNEIDISIYRLEEYLKEKNAPLTLGAIEELKMNFKIVKESECLTLENIF